MVLPQEIEDELVMARDAARDGNLGKSRVCARRAVRKAFGGSGIARTYGESLSSIQCLKIISESAVMPDDVRKAAIRLLTSVASVGGAISAAPVDDAILVIEALLGRKREDSL